jgi:hypothetical protein
MAVTPANVTVKPEGGTGVGTWGGEGVGSIVFVLLVTVPGAGGGAAGADGGT